MFTTATVWSMMSVGHQFAFGSTAIVFAFAIFGEPLIEWVASRK